MLCMLIHLLHGDHRTHAAQDGPAHGRTTESGIDLAELQAVAPDELAKPGAGCWGHRYLWSPISCCAAARARAYRGRNAGSTRGVWRGCN